MSELLQFELPETYVSGFHIESEVRKMKYFSLGETGMKVSQLSLGAGGFCSQYGDYTSENLKSTLHEAIKRGINYIDTAPWYGQGVSEIELGKCLQGIPRKAYYIATKVGRYEKNPKEMFDFSGEKTKKSIETSLKRLGLDYIDVLQIHDIEFAPSFQILLEETLPEVKAAVDSGKAKFIGVTGYPVSVLSDFIKKCESIHIDTVLSYTRLSLLDNTLKEFLPYFESKKLGIINAAVHCMGLLSDTGPQDWHPASEDIKKICREAGEFCKKNNVELGKLALYYALQQKGPHTNLVGMNTLQLLNTNLDVVHNGLSKKEEEVYNYIKNNILNKLLKNHWEQVEVNNYWKKIKELQ